MKKVLLLGGSILLGAAVLGGVLALTGAKVVDKVKKAKRPYDDDCCGDCDLCKHPCDDDCCGNCEACENPCGIEDGECRNCELCDGACDNCLADCADCICDRCDDCIDCINSRCGTATTVECPVESNPWGIKLTELVSDAEKLTDLKSRLFKRAITKGVPVKEIVEYFATATGMSAEEDLTAESANQSVETPENSRAFAGEGVTAQGVKQIKKFAVVSSCKQAEDALRLVYGNDSPEELAKELEMLESIIQKHKSRVLDF